jgi:hypothetical protein
MAIPSLVPNSNAVSPDIIAQLLRVLQANQPMPTDNSATAVLPQPPGALAALDTRPKKLLMGPGGPARAPSIDINATNKNGPTLDQPAVRDTSKGWSQLGASLGALSDSAVTPVQPQIQSQAQPPKLEGALGEQLPSTTPPATNNSTSKGPGPGPDSGDFLTRLMSNKPAMALITGGLSMMQAASQPGATLLGSLGYGGEGALNFLGGQEAAKQAEADKAQTRADKLQEAQDRRDYLKEMMDERRDAAKQTSTDRQAAIAERAQATKDSLAERDALARLAASNKTPPEQYGSMVPGTGVDPSSGKQVPGVYVLDKRTGQPTFQPGITLTGRQKTEPPGVTPNAAQTQAQKDWAEYSKQSADGTVMNADGTPAKKSLWIKDRVQSYLNTKNGPDTSPSSLPTLKSPADIKTLGLKSGDHFLTPDGREKIVP